MQRTNIYLDEEQLRTLRLLGEQRGAPVAALVREAVDAWLRAQGVERIEDDDWQRRFDAFFAERKRLAGERGFDPEEVERDVMDAVREVRKARAARRR